MKHLVLAALVSGAFATTSFATEPSPACAAKRADIEAQISEATTRGRKQEIAGLQRALKANKGYCTNESLAKDRDRDIKSAKKKVAEREKSLAEAQRKGDAKKIADRQAKLDIARGELVKAEKPVSP